MFSRRMRCIGGLVLTSAVLFTGCGGGGKAASTEEAGSSSEKAEREIHYFSSRSSSDDTLLSLQEVTDSYNKEGGKIKLIIDSNADRSSYDQKLRTMIAGQQMPDMFDLDASPYAVELGNQGMLTDMDQFLDEIGEKDSYIPLALNYGRTSDGKLYTLPLEFSTEMIWYNTEIFSDAGIQEAPKTLDELLADCKILKEKGYTPFGIGGGDGWPLLRLLATYPFRLSGNDFLNRLASGEAKMEEEPGVKASEFLSLIHI